MRLVLLHGIIHEETLPVDAAACRERERQRASEEEGNDRLFRGARDVR
jgi:hypothetical protein